MKITTLLYLLGVVSSATAQIPVEFSAGSRSASGDVLWMKPFDQGSPLLFFQRTRVSGTYDNAVTFGTLGIISYNFPSGFGIAAEGRVSQTEFAPGVGVQYYDGGNTASVFALATIGFAARRSYNYFIIGRYSPPLGDSFRGFLQVEASGAFRDDGHTRSNLRHRVGIDARAWQVGVMLDMAVVSGDRQILTGNPGVFVRKVF